MNMNTTQHTPPQPGATIYWRRIPSGRFTFVKTNRDGSFQLYGGETGYASYRDARPDDVSLLPFEGTDQIIAWALQNTYHLVKATELAERFGLSIGSVRKAITDRPDIFRRVEHGVFECRNPDEDRAFDRRKREDA